MPIRVTCPGCHTRFNVSDRFAGRDGPCPKCKATIRIPDKSHEVVIHAPEEASLKAKHEAITSRPIFRRELVITPLHWTVILGVIGTLLALAALLRWQVADKANFPLWILIVGAAVVAIPAVYAGYGVLRDTELESFRGRDLWMRVGICAAIYAALWLAMPVAAYALNGYDTIAWSLAMGLMIVIGGAVGMSMFDFDYLIGVLHFGMYLGTTLLLRWIAGIGVFPGQLRAQAESVAAAMFQVVSQLAERLL